MDLAPTSEMLIGHRGHDAFAHGVMPNIQRHVFERLKAVLGVQVSQSAKSGHDAFSPMVVVSSYREGRTMGMVIPNLLSYTGSAVISDPLRIKSNGQQAKHDEGKV